jgi:hypothetical protein
MDQLIMLIVYIILFCVVAYGLNWVCITYAIPQPIRWIVGGILLIVILLFLSRQLGVGSGGGSILPHRP